MKTGRPPKSEKAQHRWLAAIAAIQLRKALELMRNGLEAWDDENPEFEADWERKTKAWGRVGVIVCDFCDPDKPSTFLRQVADELDGKLNSLETTDYKIFDAWWHAWCNGCGERPTYAEWEEQFKKLWNNNSPLPRDSSLRRSIKRLGLPIRLVKS